jgi:NADPH-dependent glutamate synthase beta subunit-like oxidoreductase/Pyruvate/2-oxoacid:ferredoxin oxidoreductase delta subunit
VADSVAPVPRISISSSSTLANRTGSWKYIRPEYRDSVAPCNARCPTGVDVEGYLDLLRRNEVTAAQQLLLRENPMPAVTGRVCHHPCEGGCNRASFDEPVAVHLIERYLGDSILQALPEPFPRTHAERVAIIGSGPAGLACAYHIARLGYGVTVFEAAPEAGGMLRLGIPAYRLPRDILDRQIDWLRACGIDILCNAAIRRDDVAALLEGFDAVFAASGAHHGRPLGVAGEDGPGVRAGLDFLKAVNRGERPEIGRHVVVVGGGNTAMDCARAALRLGAEVTVVYRRTRAEMPAIADEIEEAQREGVAFEFLAAPRALQHVSGALIGIECERMVLGEPDASGRRRPVAAPDSAFSIPSDLVLTAIGEEAILDSLPEDALLPDGTVRIDELGATAHAKLWAGGDAAGVERTVSDALGSGKAAAIGIDRALRALRGEPAGHVADLDSVRWAGGCFSMARWHGDDPVRRTAPVNRVAGFDTLNTTHFQHVPRHTGRVRRSEIPDFAEVNQGLLPDDFMAEARRCFNCGVCNECELCLIFCADVAISRSDAGGFVVDLDHCKGCGVCAYECPRGAIVMTREDL